MQYHQQPYGQPSRPVQAQPYPAQPYGAQPYGAQPPRPAAPSKMACYSCKRHFGVPPNTSIAACPFCQTHNRVPGM